MTGIAITLATGADGEAVERIEKLLGRKLPRSSADGPKAEAEPERADTQPTKPAGRAPPKKSAKAKPARAEKPPKVVPEPRKEPAAGNAPGDWNGPMPSFLSVGAGD